MDFAIIKTGGKQYKVEEGQKLKVEKLESDKKSLEFTDLLNNKKVTAQILNNGKRDKIRIVKHNPKKRYKRITGHRQEYTEILIKKIV